MRTQRTMRSQTQIFRKHEVNPRARSCARASRAPSRFLLGDIAAACIHIGMGTLRMLLIAKRIDEEPL
jgi:hypothetical protein